MGGDHHGHGHHQPYAIPDWKIYKVEDVPELLEVKNALASKGLKDPWLRNEVWRFNPQQFGTHGQRFRSFFFRGFKYGFVAFVATILVEGAVSLASPKDHGHEHH